jgi:hypothetical protein
MSEIDLAICSMHSLPLQGGGLGWGSMAASKDDPLLALRADLSLSGGTALHFALGL